MHRTLTTLAALAAGPALAQPFEITRSTIDNGGGTLSSANYTLSGTSAQPDASEALAGSSYTLRGGFWAPAASTARLCADQNGDGVVAPADFNAWVLNFNSQNLLADVNQDTSITPADFNAWVLAFNQGANGPLCNP